MADVVKIGKLPLIETAKKSTWYLPVRREGPFGDTLSFMHAFIKKALHSALKGAIIEYFEDDAEKIAKMALSNGFKEFDADIGRSMYPLGIVLRFRNQQTDQEFTRRLSQQKITKPFNVHFHLGDMVDIVICVESHVLAMDGIEPRRHRSRRKKRRNTAGG
jgi:hypothetical protein